MYVFMYVYNNNERKRDHESERAKGYMGENDVIIF